MSIITIVLGLLPGFAWLFFFLQEDAHQEPKRLILKTFLAGAAGAAFALIIQIFLNSTFGLLKFQSFIFLSFVILAFVEEAIKFLAAYWSIHKNPAFDEPVDAMIYMVVAALGFATVENLGAVSGGGSGGQLALLSNAFTTSTLRFVGATLLHALTSALVGYFWAIGIRKFMSKKYILYGLAFATLLHGFFNYLIISFEGSVIYSILFLIVIAFFVLGDFEKLKGRII
ncbi:MAG: PrsW family glutamic-type intramembrane protease [Patescibacteria group bacterium]